MHSKQQHSGFTLIELMITVAIIGIIAAVAYPNYTSHVKNTRRTAAAACLTETTQRLERDFTTNMKYPTTLPALSCHSETAAFYTYSFSGTPTNTTYTIQAAPAGAQASDSCGNLTLTQAGVKGAGGSTLAACWK